jgi:hypothetical protein
VLKLIQCIDKQRLDAFPLKMKHKKDNDGNKGGNGFPVPRHARTNKIISLSRNQQQHRYGSFD